jgi:flagellar capping protein FliD
MINSIKYDIEKLQEEVMFDVERDDEVVKTELMERIKDYESVKKSLNEEKSRVNDIKSVLFLKKGLAVMNLEIYLI